MEKSTVSTFARMLRVLDLFSEDHLARSVDEIADELEVSIPTAYRYIKLLTQSGLLQRVAESRYTLGPRVIVLDHLIRIADPILKHAVPIMRELVAATGFDCVISALFDHRLLDTHREFASEPVTLTYGRGRLRPLFRGAGAKVILAGIPSSHLHRLFDARRDEVRASGLPVEWSEFRRYYAAIRRAGHYFSDGELEPNVSAVATTLHRSDGSIAGSISLVSTRPRMAVVDRPRLVQVIRTAATSINSRLE
ncbi:MAG: helix-turn-helix domain-containing protein [Burkholderiales bacterium]|nr:helix-turn-helix domain-containing protein [Burkholderiales bacterium]